jgi:hypothetical protein
VSGFEARNDVSLAKETVSGRPWSFLSDGEEKLVGESSSTHTINFTKNLLKSGGFLVRTYFILNVII